MKENVIISLADANYFELLNELIDSIKMFNESKNIAICILDAGLKDNQKDILISKVDDDSINKKEPIKLEGLGDKNLSFVFVEDVANVIIKVVEKGVVGKTYDVANDEVISCRELVRLFFKIMNKSTHVMYTFNEEYTFRNKECVFSNKLTKNDLDVRFESLKAGILEYIISKS